MWTGEKCLTPLRFNQGLPGSPKRFQIKSDKDLSASGTNCKSSAHTGQKGQPDDQYGDDQIQELCFSLSTYLRMYQTLNFTEDKTSGVRSRPESSGDAANSG